MVDARRGWLGASRDPARLALLEERGEAVLRLGAAPHAGERLGQRRAVLLPARLGPADEQLLDPRLRLRRALQQLAHALAHLRVQTGGWRQVVHEADLEPPRGVESLPGEHQLARGAVP